jgi:hypothetical protein
MKEKPRRKITVTSSFAETSTDQLGNRLVVRRGRGKVSLHPRTAALLDRY